MAQKRNTQSLEKIIVGAGPSGLVQLVKNSNQELIVLESEDRVWGRASHGSLHLIKTEGDVAQIEEAKIRWEREWLSANDFEFDSKEWFQIVPQWNFYKNGKFNYFQETELPQSLKEKIKKSTPVSKIERHENKWTLETPDMIYETNELVWTAGLEPFQNAIGKEVARDFLVANPRYDADARESMGGVAMNWIFENQSNELLETVPHKNLLFLPVKQNKIYYLCICAIKTEPALEIRTLCYLPQEILKYPKEVISFQKSLRRVLKYLFNEKAELKPREVFIQSPKLLGHSLGMPWVLNSDRNGIQFVGDEAIDSLDSGQMGLVSVECCEENFSNIEQAVACET